jgi:hypothetical protein
MNHWVDEAPPITSPELLATRFLEIGNSPMPGGTNDAAETFR